MASAQVDRLNMSVSTIAPGGTGNAGTEHVAPGSFSSIQDANLLREAALRSRRRKQAASREQPAPTPPAQPITVSCPPEKHVRLAGDEDVPMEDAVVRPAVVLFESDTTAVDTEDGEILENNQASSSGSSVSETDLRRKTPRPLSDVSDNSATTVSGVEAPKYVRLGLKMTARDLDEAKSLILDLLGLGVTPEYLVDCGVSPQCLAVCFYEMNLRFPLNLDRRQIDLPPFYDLDKHMKDSQRREQIIRQRDRGQLTPKLINITAAGAPEDKGTSISGRSLSPASSNSGNEQSLVDTPPAAPYVDNGQRGINGTQTEADSSPSPAGSTLAREGLNPTTMEDQKRMELLARKAAMDSINKKRAAKNTAILSSNIGQINPQASQLDINDVESAVDALLASVRMDSTPSGQPDEKSGKGSDVSADDGDPLPDYDSDAMVEDELGAHSPSFSDPDFDDKLMDSTLPTNSQHNLSSKPVSSDVATSIPSTSRVRFEAPKEARSSSLPAHPIPIAVPVVARRSRPIASDFIDQAPPRSSSVLSGETERGAPLKRKRSFVDPAVWPKRLVIDLDSSDEDEDEDEGARPSTSGASILNGKGNGERVPSKNGSRDKPANEGRDLAAQMLLEKELQIKAMMQKIKMREMQKKKSASGSGTPIQAAAGNSSTSSVVEASKLSPLLASGSMSAPILSPRLSALNNTPMETPRFEVPPESVMVPAEKQVKAPASNDEALPFLNGPLGITVPKLDKGKSKAVEPEEEVEGVKDAVTSASTVTPPDPETQFDHSSNLVSEKQAPTHFKAYTSPLIGFTSPDLQHSAPTDQQLPTIYWISSVAGQQCDVNRQLCQYEFPGGTCRDQGCTDIHTRDFGASDDKIRKTASMMFPNAGPDGLSDIITRVRQSARLQS